MLGGTLHMTIRYEFVALALLGGWSDTNAAERPLAVSLVQLIANPEDYDGKFIRVIGFFRMEFEGDAIYLHQEDYKHALTCNGLWIDVTDDIRNRQAEFDQKYVLVEGTFNAKGKGHMGMWSGAIEKISRWYIWSAPRQESVLPYVATGVGLLLSLACYRLGLKRGRTNCA